MNRYVHNTNGVNCTVYNISITPKFYSLRLRPEMFEEVHPYSTLCLNKIVSLSHHYLVEKAITISKLCHRSPMIASSYLINRFHVLSSVTCFYGLKHINSRLLLGCGRRFYNANRYPLQVYTSKPLQIYMSRVSCWQWLRTRQYSFIEIFIILNILFVSLERIPYSKRIHMVISSNKLERFIGRFQWKYMEKEYQGRVLPPKHPQSVRVKSILREIVQGMHSGLVLKRDCNVSGFVPISERHESEGTLLVSMVHQESQKRPKKSIIKLGTRHLEGLNWEVMVVESYEENASYHPDGKIVIYTGMLEFCDSDAEIAFVLGHEVGHGVARHASEHLLILLWTFAIFGHVHNIFTAVKPVYMYISRRRELEADYIGLMLMASAGYDPQAAPQHHKKSDHSEEDWLSTHPSRERRARLLNENKVMGEALAIYKEVRSGHRVKCFV